MSKGNANKRRGTRNELLLWRKLQELDPHGEWESRTRLPSGSRRPSAPPHGWDLWSDARSIGIEAKAYKNPFRPNLIAGWCRQAIDREADKKPDETFDDTVVMFRKAGCGQYWVAEMGEYVEQIVFYIEPLEQWVQLMQTLEEAGLTSRWSEE